MADNYYIFQLIAGLYTFRVQVTGTNEFGEAYVNVTVNPRKLITEEIRCIFDDI